MCQSVQNELSIWHDFKKWNNHEMKETTAFNMLGFQNKNVVN